jgi:hypothetical protein
MLSPSPCSPEVLIRPASMSRISLSNSNRGHQQGTESILENVMAYPPSPGWYVFIIRLWSLLSGGCSFGGCQVEYIEFKRHDPHKIMENHLAQYNLKRYVHENSPHDEIFRGVGSYEEVLNRVQTLSPDQQANFLSSQRHR